MSNAPQTSGAALDGAPFDALVFAGGGCRCFWQIGFLDALAEHNGALLAPRHVVGVSAGSAMATMRLAGGTERARQLFAELTAQNDKNVYPERLWRRGEPVMPHVGMYSAALRGAFDAEALATLAQAPPIDVLLARPPRWLPPAAGLLLGFGAYMLERRFRDGVHPSWPAAIGFTPELVRVQDVIAGYERDPEAAREALVALVLASSCTPPVTPFLSWAGQPVFDGGLFDNVPAFAVPADCERTLVMLTRRYPEEQLPRDPRKLFVQPSEPIPVDKWDYTSPELLDETYGLGRRDGEAFASAV
jgi:predicted acylesterase/phospholipase RssA